MMKPAGAFFGLERELRTTMTPHISRERENSKEFNYDASRNVVHCCTRAIGPYRCRSYLGGLTLAGGFSLFALRSKRS